MPEDFFDRRDLGSVHWRAGDTQLAQYPLSGAPKHLDESNKKRKRD